MNEITTTTYEKNKAQFNIFLNENKTNCKPHICSSLKCVNLGKDVTEEPCVGCWFVEFNRFYDGV